MFSPLSDGSFLDQRVDFVFYGVLLLSIACFLIGEIFWFLKKIKSTSLDEIQKKHFETAWSLIPLLVLLFLTCVQNQFFSPVHLKKSETQNSPLHSSPELNTNSETQNVKDELNKNLRIQKSDSAVRM